MDGGCARTPISSDDRASGEKQRRVARCGGLITRLIPEPAFATALHGLHGPDSLGGDKLLMSHSRATRTINTRSKLHVVVRLLRWPLDKLWLPAELARDRYTRPLITTISYNSSDNW